MFSILFSYLYNKKRIFSHVGIIICTQHQERCQIGSAKTVNYSKTG